MNESSEREAQIRDELVKFPTSFWNREPVEWLLAQLDAERETNRLLHSLMATAEKRGVEKGASELDAERATVAALHEQINKLCHDEHVSGPVTAKEFCDGCEAFQVKLFGASPITELKVIARMNSEYARAYELQRDAERAKVKTLREAMKKILTEGQFDHETNEIVTAALATTEDKS